MVDNVVYPIMYILMDINNALIQSMRNLFYGDSSRGDIVPVKYLPGRL